MSKIAEKQKQIEQEKAPEIVQLRRGELRWLQTQYFCLQKAPPTEAGEITDARLWHEFDELLENQFVRAVKVSVPLNTLYVYTTRFPHRPNPGRLVGPYRIELGFLKPGSERWKIYPAHMNTVQHDQGAGRVNGYHCFGNVIDLLNKLLNEVRVCEALGVMFEAFQSGGPFFRLDNLP